jgi:hypothetical protein
MERQDMAKNIYICFQLKATPFLVNLVKVEVENLDLIL